MKIIRILTLISYFMPFIFLTYACDGIDTIPFYNRVEAAKWNKDHPRKPVESVAIESTTDSVAVEEVFPNATIKENVVAPLVTKPEVTKSKEIDFVPEILTFLISPADESLSGTGIMMLYNNLTGRIFIAISFLASLIVVVISFFRRQRLKTELIIQSMAVVCLISFIVISFFFVKADLLWGFWLCFLLSAISLGWQITRVKKV